MTCKPSKRGKLWYVKYSLKGKTVRKSHKDKKTALEYKAQLERKFPEATFFPVYKLLPGPTCQKIFGLQLGTNVSALGKLTLTL